MTVETAKTPQVKVDWDRDNKKLTQQMSQSSTIVLKCIQNFKLNRTQAAQKMVTLEFEAIQPIQKLSERLNQTIQTIFAVDHTIFIMFKMIQVAKALIKLQQKPMNEKQYEEMKKATEAMTLYLYSALAFIQALFQIDV